jgi:hypothetical protein
MIMYASSQSIVHYGIKGQKWGVRHWQNEDGTFNEAGKRKYFGQEKADSLRKKANKAQLMADMNRRASETGPKILSGIYKSNERYYQNRANKLHDKSEKINTPEYIAKRKSQLKKAAVIGASVAAAGLAAYGGYKIYSLNKQVKSWEQFDRKRDSATRVFSDFANKEHQNWLDRGGVTYSRVSQYMTAPDGRKVLIGDIEFGKKPR